MIPLIVTVLLSPAFLSAKLPMAVDTLRLSPDTRPLNPAFVVVSVAPVVPSYTLSAAVMPVTALMVALLMLAVVLAELVVKV